MRSIELRRRYELVESQIRKARRRYLRLCFGPIRNDHSLLWTVADNMVKRGLYSRKSYPKDVRFWILRAMYKADGGKCWSSWLLRNGFWYEVA